MAWLNMDFNSQSLGMPVVVDVLIPQGHGGYKTLYLLHGAGGDHASWLLKTRIADYAERNNIAVVMPSGNNKCYANNLHGKNYEDFIINELIEKCETFLSLSRKKEDRFIAGMSMGGFGAINLATKYPEKFAFAASYSGLLNMIERYDNPQGLSVNVIFGERDEFTGSDNDLIHRIGGIKPINVDKTTKFLITCGLDDSRIEMSRQMCKLMYSKGFDIVYNESKGNHDFDYWDECIKRTCDYIGGGFNGSY